MSSHIVLPTFFDPQKCFDRNHNSLSRSVWNTTQDRSARSKTRLTCEETKREQTRGAQLRGLSHPPSAANAVAVRSIASHSSRTCLASVEGVPTHIRRHVRPPSLVDEKNDSPDDMMRDLYSFRCVVVIGPVQIFNCGINTNAAARTRWRARPSAWLAWAIFPFHEKAWTPALPPLSIYVLFVGEEGVI